MTTLQIGFGKSGNYWLWSLVSRLLRAAGHTHRSYVQAHPIYSYATTLSLSFPEQADIDFLSIEPTGIYMSVLPFFNMRICDEQSYYSSVSHVWTHSHYSPRMSAVCRRFSKRIYIIRDPRDVAVSFDRFNRTPFHERYYGVDIRPHDVAIGEDFGRVSTRWLAHVVPFLRHRDSLRLHVVFYEDLKNNLNREISVLARHLELTLDETSLARIASQVSFETMKKRSGGRHVANGQVGTWRDVVPTIMDAANPSAELGLRLLGYRTEREEIGFPRLPAPDDPILERLDSAVADTRRRVNDELSGRTRHAAFIT